MLPDTPAFEETKMPFLVCCLFRDITEKYIFASSIAEFDFGVGYFYRLHPEIR